MELDTKPQRRQRGNLVMCVYIALEQSDGVKNFEEKKP
jgi:hypothetical protein